eukprot:TRINITY_DN4562_c0_g1_i1.p1 TRINITY_DN4562_c0_g1~~TRINITY_DN4562_c0_g1_i1.p1  ORF type:complete len:317 (+),score=79.71 TRINITY_DN4562_c0_g1_i1:3-953(+)
MTSAAFSFNFNPEGNSVAPKVESWDNTSTCATVKQSQWIFPSPTQTDQPQLFKVPFQKSGSAMEFEDVPFSAGLTLKKRTAISLKKGLELYAYGSQSRSVELLNIVGSSDLRNGVYEGGFKLWECAIDLIEYMREVNFSLEGKIVLELGCGHGLPGIYALVHGKAKQVIFQDYNEEVLHLLTIPNVGINEPNAPLQTDCSKEGASRFMSGDWQSVGELLAKEGIKVDVILSSETIYCESSLGKLVDLVDSVLAPSGIALFAAKTYYFSVGGGTDLFKRELEIRKGGQLCVGTVKQYADGVSNVREILLVKRSPQGA